MGYVGMGLNSIAYFSKTDTAIRTAMEPALLNMRKDCNRRALMACEGSDACPALDAPELGGSGACQIIMEHEPVRYISLHHMFGKIGNAR